MSTVVVIPTYNEALNIGPMIAAVLAAEPDADILVVDDNSPDGTAGLVANFGDARVHLLNRAEKEGLGAAYRAGFQWALNAGYDRIVQMDADFSHPPAKVPELLAALDNAEVAVGSRYVEGGGIDNWSWSRRLISWAGNLYVRIILGLSVRDATAGFKAFRTEALVRLGALDAASNGYCFQIENTWRACRLGMRVVEVPITFTDRTEGTSKMSGSIVREALKRVLFWRWTELYEFGMRERGLERFLNPEVFSFLAVGGAGYVVDVAAFNYFRATPALASHDPSVSKILAVIVAMIVTFIGNRVFTWRGESANSRRKQIALFVLFNAIGLGFSVVTLTISHDILGLTSVLADNISANVIGLALGTAFRYWSYKRFVFGDKLSEVDAGHTGRDIALTGGDSDRSHLLER
ncbi:MAG: glycosyltransferase family 2 protein [Aeromicrobium sp.]